VGTPPLTGQIVTTGTAAKLTAVPCQPTNWTVKAPVANASTVYIGQVGVTTATGYPLEPGDSIEIDRRATAGAVFDLVPADLYVVGSGGTVAWLAFL
jgi:hypothetical protein